MITDPNAVVSEVQVIDPFHHASTVIPRCFHGASMVIRFMVLSSISMVRPRRFHSVAMVHS